MYSSGKADLKTYASSKGDRKGKKPPTTPCPLPKFKGKNHFQWIADSKESTQEEKQHYRQELAAAKAHDRTVSSTRLQTGYGGSASKSGNPLQKIQENHEYSPSFRMKVSVFTSSLDVVGRCDDGSDENIANPAIVEKAVFQGFGAIKLIPKVRLRVALKKEGE